MKKSDTSKPPRLIQAVDRAMNILKTLSNEPTGLTLTGIAREMDLPVQTAQGLLRTLQHHAMVTQSMRGGAYQLGPAVSQLAEQWHLNQDRPALARPFVRQLAEKVNESVLIAELNGATLTGLLNTQSNQPLSVGYENQTFADLHTLACGKLLLAFLDENEQKRIVGTLKLMPHAPRTITSRPKFIAHLKQVAKQGYALSVEEAVKGVAAIAVPIRNHAGHADVALGIALPAVRFNPARKAELLAEMQKTATAIEKAWSQR